MDLALLLSFAELHWFWLIASSLLMKRNAVSEWLLAKEMLLDTLSENPTAYVLFFKWWQAVLLHSVYSYILDV